MDEIDDKSDSEEVMELLEIIDRLDESADVLPVAAIQAARQQRDAITPLLIELLEAAAHDWHRGLEVESNGHLYAIYLLAEFRATEAWPAVLAVSSLPGEGPFDLYGDTITEDLAYILAAVLGDRTEPLDEMIVDRDLNLYVRWQAIDGLLFQFLDGVVTRESVVERLVSHLEWAIEAGDELTEAIVLRLSDLGVESALPLIETAFSMGLVSPDMIDLESIQETIACGDMGFLETIAGLRRPDDMIPYMSNWAMFQEGVDGDTDSFDFSSLKRMDDGCDDAAYHLENTSTIRYESAKIGRNEACPCGSGKKYKKCCGAPGKEKPTQE
ncbi:MAG: DUF1186 domain-containing protein [Planctomycetales bacterium]|nr:DUF1186 domain-containing protein [Planctomycetales bacterium]